MEIENQTHDNKNTKVDRRLVLLTFSDKMLFGSKTLAQKRSGCRPTVTIVEKDGLKTQDPTSSSKCALGDLILDPHPLWMEAEGITRK